MMVLKAISEYAAGTEALLTTGKKPEHDRATYSGLTHKEASSKRIVSSSSNLHCGAISLSGVQPTLEQSGVGFLFNLVPM